jgi:membrane protease YdiL (CAAX protease family)
LTDTVNWIIDPSSGMAASTASTGSQRERVARAHDAVPGGDPAAARCFWIVSGGVLIFWAGHNALLLPWELRNIDVAVREPALILVRAVFWMVPILLYLRWHDPRARLVALGVTSPVNRRGLARSALSALVYLSLVALLVRATSPPGKMPGVFATFAQLQVLYMLLVVALEELLMRGFLLGQLVRFTTSFRAQACVAVLFALMHLPAWLALQGATIDLLPSMISLTVLGAVLGGVARASNSILPAIALHFANNMLAKLLGGN